MSNIVQECRQVGVNFMFVADLHSAQLSAGGFRFVQGKFRKAEGRGVGCSDEMIIKKINRRKRQSSGSQF